MSKRQDQQFNQFDAPIPGESLTRPPQSSPMENPPNFTDPEQASEVLFSKLTQPQNSVKIKKMLQAGASAESIARTVLFTGTSKGEFTPDLALLLARPTLGMVAAIGKKTGAGDFKMMNDDPEMDEFFASIGGVGEQEEPIEEEPENLGGLLGSLMQGEDNG